MSLISEKGEGSRLFGSIWFQLLCVACTTYCFWLLSPVKAKLIRDAEWEPGSGWASPYLDRALRNWIGAQDHGDLDTDINPSFSSGSSRSYNTSPEQMVTGQLQREDGNVSTTSIRLGSGKLLSKKDLLRAQLCSAAVYLDNGGAENLLKRAEREFPTFDQFEQVHMAMNDENWQCKYLVAYAADAIFIAFRGTDNLVDMADNLIMTKSSSKYGGKFHAGFFKRSELFLRPNNKLDVLLKSGKRIILCGHSQGAAVSHLVLLGYFQEKGITLTSGDYPDSLFSIGFGMPHVCDRLVAGMINQDEHMRWRFITFVNQADPVPRLLHHLPSTIMITLKEPLGYFINSDSILAQFGGFAGETLRNDGPEPRWKRMVRHLGVSMVARTLKNYVDNYSCTVGYRIIKFCNTMGRERDPNSEFHPIGQYVFLTRRRPQLERDKWGPWEYNIEQAQNREMTELCLISGFKRSDFENHTLDSYKTALRETAFLDSPRIMTSRTDHGPDRGIDLIVSTPSPVISEARLHTSASQQVLRIKGKHLLFLYEPIRYNNDCEYWQILEPVADDDLNLLRDDTKSKRVTAEQAMHLINIKTAFGSTEHYIPLKNSVKSEESQSFLRAVVQVLALKTTSRMNRTPPPDVLTQLDNVVQCATPLQESEGYNLQYLSPIFKAIRGANPGDNITKHIKDANSMIEKVVIFLLTGRFMSIDSGHFSEPLRVATPSTVTRWGQYLWRGTKIALAVSGAAVGGGAVGLLGGAVVVGALALEAGALYTAAVAVSIGSVGAGSAVYNKMSTSEPLLPPQGTKTGSDYLEWLELAIEEASEWKSHPQRHPLANTVSPRPSVSALEKKLRKQVEASGEFKEMVKHSHCNNPTSCSKQQFHDIRLRSPKFGASAQNLTPKQLLQRINIVVTTHGLYKEVVGEKFVTIVGAEDAGKSTFIKEVMKKFGSPRRDKSEMPMTGVDCHTEDVRAYQVTNKLCLVDFPGGNGIGDHADRWQEFNMLPGFAILFLDFKDDLKREQKEMYVTMKQGLEKNPIVVFNKVDKSFTPDQYKTYTKAYFEEKRKKIARELECYPGEVYYMSVRPNAFHDEETIGKMHSSGVVDMKTFANKVLGLDDSDDSGFWNMRDFTLCS